MGSRRNAALRLFVCIISTLVILWAIYNFLGALYWSYKEKDTQDLPLATVILVTSIGFSASLIYSAYENNKPIYKRVAFIIAPIPLLLTTGQLIMGLYTRHFDTETTLYKLEIDGEDVSTLVILLAFLKILLAATPMVALSLLWKWTEGPPKSDTIQQKDRLLSKNSLSYNTPEDVHVDSPSPYP